MKRDDYSMEVIDADKYSRLYGGIISCIVQ